MEFRFSQSFIVGMETRNSSKCKGKIQAKKDLHVGIALAQTGSGILKLLQPVTRA